MRNRAKTVLSIFLLFALGFPVLYGEIEVPESELVFSHALHVGEFEIDCTDCHVTIPDSQKAADQNISTHRECAACHEAVLDENECGMCHKVPDAIVSIPLPTRKILFSHKDHIRRDLECSDCHAGVAASARPSSKNMPDMTDCTVCHDDRIAPLDCGLCHVDPDAISRMAHPEGWRHAHKYEASRDDTSCRACHPTKDYCLDCHEGDNLQQFSHPRNYAFNHTLDAKGKEKDCIVCHTSRSFCEDCHASKEVMPLSHSSASWPNRDHGLAAVRDLEMCAACHDEGDPTCLRCHRDPDGIIGTDPSPHGPGYGSEQGRGPWHDDPGDLCFRCHSRGLAIQGLGFCGYCHEGGKGFDALHPPLGGDPWE